MSRSKPAYFLLRVLTRIFFVAKNKRARHMQRTSKAYSYLQYRVLKSKYFTRVTYVCPRKCISTRNLSCMTLGKFWRVPAICRGTARPDLINRAKAATKRRTWSCLIIPLYFEVLIFNSSSLRYLLSLSGPICPIDSRKNKTKGSTSFHFLSTTLERF